MTTKKKTSGSEPHSQGKIQSEFPKDTLEEALRVPEGLENANGGQPLPPIETASAIDVSPGSSDFRRILSSSFKYGLTIGTYKSDRVALEELGRNVVEPKDEEGRKNALVQAVLTPPTFRSIYQHFKGKKLPEATFFENTIVREFGVPREHAKKCVDVFCRNAEFAGLVRTLPSGKWLSTEPVSPTETAHEFELKAEPEGQNEAEKSQPSATSTAVAHSALPSVPKVFIAHGKSAQIVIQLKDLLKFGNFEPVIAEEYETSAKPVPDKVLDLMRGCSAGIIHVASEDELLDRTGAVHHKLNENVLVEIGAALALYKRKFILLVQKDLHLPSNLGGLYCCYYEGDKLDYEATMKLLKAFGEFRSQ
jgi:predicted nucleotide-binding protein